MKCRYCKQVCRDNFVRKGDFVAHIPCLAQARDKQTQTKAVATSFKECNECHGNCNGNHVAYKGYWFHPSCLAKRLIRMVGAVQARRISQEVFK